MKPDDPLRRNRVNVGDLSDVQQWARQLRVSVVDLLDATRVVGTWVPAIERHLNPSSIGLPPRSRE